MDLIEKNVKQNFFGQLLFIMHIDTILTRNPKWQIMVRIKKHE